MEPTRKLSKKEKIGLWALVVSNVLMAFYETVEYYHIDWLLPG